MPIRIYRIAYISFTHQGSNLANFQHGHNFIDVPSFIRITMPTCDKSIIAHHLVYNNMVFTLADSIIRMDAICRLALRVLIDFDDAPNTNDNLPNICRKSHVRGFKLPRKSLETSLIIYLTHDVIMTEPAHPFLNSYANHLYCN